MLQNPKYYICDSSITEGLLQFNGRNVLKRAVHIEITASESETQLRIAKHFIRGVIIGIPMDEQKP